MPTDAVEPPIDDDPLDDDPGEGEDESLPVVEVEFDPDDEAFQDRVVDGVLMQLKALRSRHAEEVADRDGRARLVVACVTSIARLATPESGDRGETWKLVPLPDKAHAAVEALIVQLGRTACATLRRIAREESDR